MQGKGKGVLPVGGDIMCKALSQVSRHQDSEGKGSKHLFKKSTLRMGWESGFRSD